MDGTQSLALGSLITTVTALVAYLVKLNHKRVRSKCCNKDCTSSLDVEDTTPQTTVKVADESKNDLKITLPQSK